MLSGHEWGEVRSILKDHITSELGRYADLCKSAIQEMDDILASESTTFYTGSPINLLAVPDFQDIARFRALFSILEQEDALVDLMKRHSKKDGIGVIIGEEHDVPELENCSVVMSTGSSAGERTMLGVIGPKRMNYEKIISILDKVLCDITEDSPELNTGRDGGIVRGG